MSKLFRAQQIVLSKLFRAQQILMDYLLYQPPMTRPKIRLINGIWIVLGVMFSYYAFVIMAGMEILNFVVWYMKQRTGELQKSKEKYIKKGLEGFEEADN